MPDRLIVHMGFHMTETAAIERLLKRDRDALSGHVQIVLPQDISSLTKATKAYAITRDPLDLGFVQYEAVHCAAQWHGEVVLLSAEDLGGPLPGPRSTKDYAAAPTIAAALCEAWEEALPGTDIWLVFTQRAPAAWLDRAYAHHLRTSRLTISNGRFHEAFAGAANATAVLTQIQGTVVDAEVRAIRVEQYGDAPLGPAGALLDLADVPKSVQSGLAPIPAHNTWLSRKQREAFLLLNRSGLSDAQVEDRKRGTKK